MTDIIRRLYESRLQAYSASPGDIKEHFGSEQFALAGYGYRQVLELVQNGADAILEAHEAGVDVGNPPRIQVLLADSYLYVANTGAPFSEEGIEALLRAHTSPKRGNQIGRFGLGFKSLLRLGGKIDITSRQIAFRLDPDRCRAELKDRFKVDEDEVPGLRLAWPLDQKRADALQSRFPWATTVVCAEIKDESFVDHLRKEIEGFPAEFLLFLPVSVNLTLDSGASSKSERQLRCESDGVNRILRDGETTSHWRVVEKAISITDQRAKDNATKLHARDEVPLAWGMPIDGRREEAGRFWAFFPTGTPTYLPGILNAPWNLNSDRNAIIPGEWNTYLMKEAARLIAGELPHLPTKDDPARAIDAFPRQLERKDDHAAPLVEALWTLLETASVIPDAAGTLRPARELWRHPHLQDSTNEIEKEGGTTKRSSPSRDSAEHARQWQMLAPEEHRGQLVHPSCLEGYRDSRLKALSDRVGVAPGAPNLRQKKATDWFASVASVEKEKTIKVLNLAEVYKNGCKGAEWAQICPTLAIIPSDANCLVTPDKAVFAPEGTHIPDGRHPVAQWLREDTEAMQILDKVLEVKPLDDNMWRDVLSEQFSQHSSWKSYSDTPWGAFWRLLRSAPVDIRSDFVKNKSSSLCIRRRDGKWVLADEVLLPGTLVRADDASSNQKLLVDTTFHDDTDKELLKQLGVSDFPVGSVQVWKNFDELRDWLRHWRSHYKDTIKDTIDRQPKQKYLQPLLPWLKMPKGWHFLHKLMGMANVKLTGQFLDEITKDNFWMSVVQFGHATTAKYPKIDVPHPFPWLLLRYGHYNIDGTIVRLAAIVARLDEPAMTRLPKWQELHLALEKLKTELKGILPPVHPSKEEIQAVWLALIKFLAKPETLKDNSLHDLWSGAARDRVVPESLPTNQGEIPLTQVFVTGSVALAQRVREQGHVVVTLDEDVLGLWVGNGARNLAEQMNPEWTEATGPVELLITTFPELKEVLPDEKQETSRCQAVAGLKLQVADDSNSVPCLMWDGVLLFDMAQLMVLSRSDMLKCLLTEIETEGWLKDSADKALRIVGDSKVEDRRAAVAQCTSLAERLWQAVGQREEPLWQALGEGIRNLDFVRECNGLQLAELVLAQLGPVTLTVLQGTLEEEGLKPPLRWNTTEARAFVTSLGFPEEFAASPEARRKPEEIISGPIELPPLHDFQEEVLRGIRELIDRGTGRRRAVVSLPTGGGKTRVTVEAAVRFVLKPEGDRRRVIWVAQTDELCEQAVQAFKQVWVNLGAQRTDLRIVRLWGGNPNPAIQDPNQPIVVVASIQTLNSRMGTSGIEWLRHSGLVVVDECHHAITPSYTNLLRFLNADTPKSNTPPKDEPLILGLSATPFRTDDEEAERLARRFDKRWLPADQEDLHRRLRAQGVLAEVDSEALDSGVGLTPDEIEQLSNLLHWEGLDFEKLVEAINQRLGHLKQRNEKLVERIKQAEEGSILLFSNSVAHAKEMAARLNLQGIRAASISADTPSSARRYFLERFQRGEIRVICNHTILNTGFDAPKTDMVLISRAVFSPVRYMQMVGRGLRGEQNGGTPRCRIVTVFDNLGRFQDRHPYHYCQRFFSAGVD